MVKAVLFDLDGVVVDSEPLYAKAEIKLFEEYGVTIPDEDWKLFRGSTEEGFYQLAMERYQIREDKQKLMEKGRLYVRNQFKSELRFMSGFKSLSGRISDAGYKIGLVTSSPKPMYEYVNELMSINQYFPEVIYGGMTKNSKPHPEPYLLMMKLLDVEPFECIIIEDSVHGLNAALASGAMVIALAGSVEPEDMPKAHHFVTHLDQVTFELMKEGDAACSCGKSPVWECNDICLRD